MLPRGRARRPTIAVHGRPMLALVASLSALVSSPALAAGEPDEGAAPAPSGETNDGVAPDASRASATETDDAPTDGTDTPDAAELEADDDPTEDTKVDAEPETDGELAEVEEVRPPRIDGVYVGGFVFGGLGFLRVNDFDTNGPFAAFGGTATVGQMVFPWLGVGLHGGGGGGVRSEEGARQTLGQGYLGVDFKFVPAPQRLPLSLRASFGFGGGAVRQEGVSQRSGFGGAQFSAGVRYEWFPWAKRKRPYRGGGFGLGPELGWIGFTPAAAGRPMSNVVYLALSTTFYFGS